MGAVGWLVENGLRRRWRSLLPIVLIVGVAGGLALAGLAGARRTSSAFDRMVEATDAWDVMVNPDNGTDSALTLDAVRALPMVAEAGRVDGVFLLPPDIDAAFDIETFEFASMLASDGTAYFEIGRPLVVDGRMPDPDSADQVLVDLSYARAEQVEVGDVIEARVLGTDELMVLFTGTGEEAFGALLRDRSFGTWVALTVAGIGFTPDGAVIDEGYEPHALHGTPAFWEAAGHPSAGYWGAGVRLHDRADVEEFRDALERLVPDELLVMQTLPATRAKADRAIDPPAFALGAFAVVTALLGMLLIAQTVSRRLQFDSASGDVMSAVGCTRKQRFATSIGLVGAVALCGAAVGVIVAIGLSAATPVGPARRMEPQPGLSFDMAVLLPGAGAIVVLVVLAALIPAWRAARLRASGRTSSFLNPGRLLSRAGLPVSVSTGARFALDGGRGATAVPVRATIVSAATGVAIAVATIVFAASLDRVVATPRLYGSDWDAVVQFDSDSGFDPADVATAVAASPLVSRSSEVRINEVEVNGAHMSALAFSDPAGGTVAPTIAEGRAPTSADEVALGGLTMDRLGVSLGEAVTLDAPGFSGPATVVGRAVLPAASLYTGADRTALGEGALVHLSATGNQGPVIADFVVDLRPGADPDQLQDELAETLEQGQFVMVTQTRAPSDVNSLASLRGVPLVLAALLVALIAATVANALAVAARRKRRELALLRTLGVSRGGVRAAVVWQALTVAVVAAIVGVPLGVFAGRWAWSVLATALGTVAEPVVPAVWLLVLVASIMGLAVLAALIPASRALRLRPAVILRSE